MFVAINIWVMLAYAYRLKSNHYFLYDDDYDDEYDDEYDDKYDDTGPDTIDADRARIDRINDCIETIEEQTG